MAYLSHVKEPVTKGLISDTFSEVCPLKTGFTVALTVALTETPTSHQVAKNRHSQLSQIDIYFYFFP